MAESGYVLLVQRIASHLEYRLEAWMASAKGRRPVSAADDMHSQQHHHQHHHQWEMVQIVQSVHSLYA